MDDGVYRFTIGQGNHSMLVIGKDSVAVFETLYSGHAQKLLVAVRRLTDKPIEYTFISYNHRDHTTGELVFSNAGAQAALHQRAADWLKANPGRDAASHDLARRSQGYCIKRFHCEHALFKAQSWNGPDDFHHS